MVWLFGKKTNKKWTFADPPNVAVITTKSIVSREDWIANVFHDEDDGGWQFLGTAELSTDDAAVVSLENIVDLDPSVEKLTDLPLGWQAWRDTSDGIWHRQKT